VRPILTSQHRAAGDAAIAALDYKDAASIARGQGIARRRRAALASFVIWCAVSATVWAVVVATGGGPTG
jgi:hypothetical protein